MGAKPDSGTTDKKLRALAVVADQKDYQVLCELLTKAGNGRVQVDQARSTEEAYEGLQTAAYDLLLWESNSQKIGPPPPEERLQENNFQTRLMVLQDHLTQQNIHAMIQSQACNHVCHCDLTGPCLALAILGAIAGYCARRETSVSRATIEKLQRAVEQSRDLVMITDQAGAIEYVNPAFENLTGYMRTKCRAKPSVF